MRPYLIALDQGTTSSRCIIFDSSLRVVSTAQKELAQIYPRSGWVEQDPEEIFISQYGVMVEALLKAEIRPEEVAGVGITNQRETTIVWDKETGKPICNAIVWQCRRTSQLCEELKQKGLQDQIQGRTGLPVDAYFSGTKIKWILDHVEGAREKAEQGRLLFGTVDSWLVWKLTDGKVHVTDRTNASRTMLYNIHTLEWDDFLLQALDIPRSMLPQVCSSSEVYGSLEFGGARIPISGVAGDQQAALFGQACFEKGEAKNTYGTGCFVLMNTGSQPIQSGHGLVTTLAASIGNQIRYALEGSVFMGGAVIQWLRDELNILENAAQSEEVASQVPDSGGVYVVPAFTGLGAPHWDMYARGSILGLTRGSGRSQIVRACLESIAYQTKDVVDAMVEDSGIPIRSLKVDGGASANRLLMQFQADVLGVPLIRPVVSETTELGAACLAGLAAGVWKSTQELRAAWRLGERYEPQIEQERAERLLNGWRKAVECAKSFRVN